MNRLRCFLLIAFCGGLLGCDHATKLAAEHALGAGRVVSVVPNVLELRYARNHDVAFSALERFDLPHKAIVLVGVMMIVLALTIAMWARHRKDKTNWDIGDAAYAFIVAGALGNVIDRIVRGYVVDFIHLTHWPVFNVADALIVIGLIGLGLARSRERPVISPPA
ncbi:MAG TPA: signal peptidase II [Polyangiaceae bacterium]|jgi:signal peptidase II|nr:signal peptidase II [Polyangiaceae bacterium]